MLSYTRRQEENKSFLLKQFIPARGRKRPANRLRRRFRRETIHPRKGTETRARAPRRRTARETIHPRKGTETFACAASSLRPSKQFIPARGRKLEGTLGGAQAKAKQFIPARGRKHTAVVITAATAMGNNSSPQGDGNRVALADVHPGWETIHPRKGTETGAGRK